MTDALWGVYPYLCLTLFFVVPIIRMAFRPYAWTTRASGLFNRQLIGVASLFLHWGIFLVFLGHVLGLIGGVLGNETLIKCFYWTALIGGLGTLVGSITALVRRWKVPEVRAMSQIEDYVIHIFLIAILGLSLYQVIINRIFGVAYTAASWFASLWSFSPQPELMVSVSFITKLHVIFAFALFAYFPFTKLVHLWALPVNYFVRPYQAMRTVRYRFQRKWEFSLRSDKSYLIYSLSFIVIGVIIISVFLGRPTLEGMDKAADDEGRVGRQLTGYALYVSQCARCHGNEGLGDGLGAKSPTFGQPPRDLTAGKFRFISTASGIASDQDLNYVLLRGLLSSGMPRFSALSDLQLNSLVSVINTFWKDHPESGEPIVVGERPPSTEETRWLGNQLFASNCSICHGETGLGDGLMSEVIRDWKENIVTPANLAKDEPKAGREPNQLYLRIAAGIPGGKIDRLMPPFSKGFSSRQIWAIVDYLEWIDEDWEEATKEIPREIIAGELLAVIPLAQDRGKIIFTQQGCFNCHGIEGRGGIENPNYITDTIPALNTLAVRKLNLYWPEDGEKILDILNQGKPLSDVEDLDVPQAFLVRAKFDIIMDTIREGREAGKKDPDGIQ
ncbi:MAG: respiratory nitrate reductase subunit gamma, partial [Desulfobacterales bacterium]